MRYKLLFILLIFINNLIFSQKKNNLIYSEIFKYSHQFKSDPYLKKASYFFLQKKWDSTLIYTQKQLKKKSKNVKVKDLCHYLRGASFTKKNIFKEAINQLQQVSSNFKFSNISEFYLGYLYLSSSKYHEAISHFIPLSKLSEEKIRFFNKNSILNNLGICYLQLKEYNKAEFYFKECYKNTKDTLKLIDNYGNIASLYYKIHDKENIAIEYFKKAYDLSEKLNIKKASKFNTNEKDFLIRKRKTAKNMSVIEEDNKNYKKALLYRKEFEKYHDLINNQSKIYAVAQAEKEFAVKEKQKEVTLLETENKLKETQRNNVIYIAGALLLLLLASGYFYRQKVKSNKIIASQKEDLDALNTTKDKLFSIVSHDLRSSVNALKSSNGVLLDNLASKNIDALGNLLKKNSAIVNGAYGLLDNLLNWALLQTQQGYFHPTSMRLFTIVEHVAYNYKPLLLEKELSFENTVAKKDQAFADQESLKIVLRNLLDNAIKFSKPNGSIKIYSQTTTNGFCHLVVEDTGLGMSEATRLQLLKDDGLLTKKEHEEVIGTGLGLSLVKSMIKKNNGKFTIESELGKGTKMIVSLPKTKGNE